MTVFPDLEHHCLRILFAEIKKWVTGHTITNVSLAISLKGSINHPPTCLKFWERGKSNQKYFKMAVF